MKKIKRFLLTTMILFIIIELVARFVLGLGKVPVYIENEHFEYIYAPNQEVRRFGNSIVTNEFSLRSKPLSVNDKVRILKLGDSVINGGSQTDHDSLSSTILENSLSASFGKQIRVLNAGANSWGPDNAFAYLQQYGSFDASMLVLVFSSHDLYDNMHFQKVVGVYPAWPDEQPLCATTDGFLKYAWPWIKKKIIGNEDEYNYNGINTVSKKINSGWMDFIAYTKQKNISLLVYLHASRTEVKDGGYNANGQRILQMLDSNHVSYVKGNKYITDETFYRDDVHLNDKGQRMLAQALLPYLKDHVTVQLGKK